MLHAWLTTSLLGECDEHTCTCPLLRMSLKTFLSFFSTLWNKVQLHFTQILGAAWFPLSSLVGRLIHRKERQSQLTGSSSCLASTPSGALLGTIHCSAPDMHSWDQSKLHHDLKQGLITTTGKRYLSKGTAAFTIYRKTSQLILM